MDDRITEKVGNAATSRRAILKSFGAAGVAGFAGVGSAASTGLLGRVDDTVTIVTAYSGDEPLLTKEVPAKWWDHVERARKVTERVKQDYLFNDAIPGVQAVGRVADRATVGGREGRAVKIWATPEFAATVPGEIDGIPIEVGEAMDLDLFACNTGTFDPIPGGVTVESSLGGGTSCCKVERNGTMYLLHAEHVFSGGPCYSHNIGGDPAYQSGDEFGKVAWSDPHRDAVLIELTKNRSGFKNRIEDTYMDQGGHISQNGLEDRMGDGTDMTMRGVTSCESTGPVSGVDLTAYIDCDDDGTTDFVWYDMVQYDLQGARGDSGGPIFDTYETSSCRLSLIGSLVTAGDSSSTLGPGAYALNNRYSISFYPEAAGTCTGM